MARDVVEAEELGAREDPGLEGDVDGPRAAAVVEVAHAPHAGEGAHGVQPVEQLAPPQAAEWYLEDVARDVVHGTPILY